MASVAETQQLLRLCVWGERLATRPARDPRERDRTSDLELHTESYPYFLRRCGVPETSSRNRTRSPSRNTPRRKRASFRTNAAGTGGTPHPGPRAWCCPGSRGRLRQQPVVENACNRQRLISKNLRNFGFKPCGGNMQKIIAPNLRENMRIMQLSCPPLRTDPSAAGNGGSRTSTARNGCTVMPAASNVATVLGAGPGARPDSWRDGTLLADDCLSGPVGFLEGFIPTEMGSFAVANFFSSPLRR